VNHGGVGELGAVATVWGKGREGEDEMQSRDVESALRLSLGCLLYPWGLRGKDEGETHIHNTHNTKYIQYNTQYNIHIFVQYISI